MQPRFRKGTLAVLAWVLTLGASQGAGGAATQSNVPYLVPAQPDLLDLVHPTTTNAPPKGGVYARSRGYELNYAASQEYNNAHYDAAIAAGEQIVAQYPTIYGAWELLGCSYWKSGRTNEARRTWERLVLVDPNVARAHTLMGSLALAQRQYDEAEKQFRLSLKLKPDDDSVRFALGMTLRLMHRNADAEAIFRQFLAADAERHDARMQLMLCMLDKGQYDEALTLWQGLPAATRTNNPSLLLTEVTILMNTGNTTGAIERAQAVLAADRDNETALRMLACAFEYSPQPEKAIPYLKRIIDSTKEKYLRQHTRMRLAGLYVRLNTADPMRFNLKDALGLTRAYLEEAPDNPDAIMMLGDLLGAEHNIAQAAQCYSKVLREYNPRNRRAHDGLFQLYLVQHEYDKAREQLRAMESVNPRDPYLHLWRSQLAEAQGDLYNANHEAELLEAEGAQGAVAVIIYHGVINSEFTEVLPARVLREHLLILKKAGFRFITARDLPKYLAERKNAGTTKPELVACITFDDARSDSFAYATPVLRELQVVASMHIPLGPIEEHESGACSFEEMKQYLATGCWIFGSHLMYSHDPLPLDNKGSLGYALANYGWLAKEQRIETDAEYRARIKNEYQRSREILEEHFGKPINFIAYPMGDIGQETRSGVPEAIAVNLAYAATNYDVGFIQTVFGYAVNGDNPLLYQRYEPDRSLSAEELLSQVMRNHPVFLAQRLQAQYAARSGKRQRAQAMVEKMYREGYATNLSEKLEMRIQDELYGRNRTPGNIDKVEKGPFQLDLSKPYVAAREDFLRDNYGNKIFHVLGAAGMNLTPNITAEGFGGIGQLKQDAVPLATPTNNVKLDERVVGVAPTIIFPFAMQLSGQVAQRSFTGATNTSLMHYSAELAAKPVLPLDVAAQFEHDAPPSARSVVKNTTYNMGALSANWNLYDWWDLHGGYQHYAYSDATSVDHLRLGSTWLMWEEPGLYGGLDYQYSTSSAKSLDYWTPYQLNRFYADAQLRGSYRRTYYNLLARLGIGKEGVRPEIPPATETKWQAILGLSASARIKLGEDWELNGEVSYDTMPNYNAISVVSGIKYVF